jgi:tetratricopeptide (TPR) repeat protein
MPTAPYPDQILQQAYAAHQARRHTEAELLYRDLLELSPDDIDGNNLLGLLYIECRQFAKAREVIHKAIAIQPNDPQSHYNIGIASKECGDADAAIEHFQESARLAPENIEAWVALGNMQKLEHRLSEAAESYRQAITINASHAAAQAGLSDTLNDAGVESNNQQRYEEALQFYREAVEANASNVKASLNLGILLEQLGDGESAAKAFETAIRAQPDFADAHFQLAHLKHHASTLDDVKAMKSLFASAAQSKKSKARLAYGLGKAWEKLGDYEQEFDWLVKAHDLMASLEVFDPRVVVAKFNSLKRIFSTDAVHRTGSDSGSNLVFVVGMPRSGTSLTEQILASHSDVFGAGEQMTAQNALSRVQENHGARSYPNRIPDLTVDDLDAIAAELKERLDSQSNGESLIVDTTPTNFIHLGFIAMLFPGARFIHCSRGPLDTCVSIFQHPLSGEHAYSHKLENLADYHNEYSGLMRHWQDVLGDRLFELSYETLASDFEPTVRRLLEFCGLPFQERCLRFYETPRAVRTPSASQVRQPIYTSSIGRWRRYEKQLQPLRDRLLDPDTAHRFHRISD